MIFFGKYGIDARDVPRVPFFCLYLSDDCRSLYFGGADGQLRPYPKALNFSEPEAAIDEVVRVAAAEMLPASAAIPIPIIFARPPRLPILPVPIPGPEDENDDFTPLGRLVIDLTGADFSGMHFGKADFRGAKLAGAKFAKARIAESLFDPGGLVGLDCSGADLQGASFSKLDFTGTNFAGANLAGATLLDCTGSGTNFKGAIFATRIKATLTSAIFTGAVGVADFADSTLDRCDFTDAVLPGTNFSGATLRGGTYKAGLSLAKFAGATLDGVSFVGANLAGAKFNGETPAVFKNNVDFGGADVMLADFSKTSLKSGEVKANRPLFGTSIDTRTRLAGATIDTAFLGNNWSYLDCGKATLIFASGFGTDFKANFAILTGCDFSEKKLAAAEFKSALLQGASFGNCNLEDARFDQAILGAPASGGTAADFTGARLCLADFTDADLSGVTFASTNLQQAKFVNALLQQTDFTNAFAAGVEFQKIRDRRMQGVSFVGACLVSAVFKETIFSSSLRAPSLSGALLMGTSFQGASLADAVLTNAKLSTTEGTIEVTLKPLPGKTPQVLKLTYQATILDPSITGSQTKCPNAHNGPCTVASLTTTVPEKWTQP